MIYDAGPEEFLWLVDNAKFVVTTSFHGVAFSIIFRKNFVTVTNPRAPARIQGILDLLGIPDRNVNEFSPYFDKKIDYSVADNTILIEKNRSLEYLDKILK